MNHKQEELIRLRVIVLNQSKDGPVPAIERIKAAFVILRKHGGKQGGVSERNIPIIRSVIKEFVDSNDADIQLRAQKLRKMLNERLALGKETEEPEEPAAPAPATEQVVTETSEPPKAFSISFDELVEAHDKAIGRIKWVGFSERRFDLSQTDRLNLLTEILGDLPVTVENVKALHAVLRAKNAQGWSLTNFPAFRIAEEFLIAQGVSIEPEKKEPDGFQRGLVDAEAAVARVVAAGYKALPGGCTDTNILQIALGDVALDEKSVVQLWLTFAYWFKEVLGGKRGKEGSVLMPPAARWILACICGYVNSRHIGIYDPSSFTFDDGVAFRS